MSVYSIFFWFCDFSSTKMINRLYCNVNGAWVVLNGASPWSNDGEVEWCIVKFDVTFCDVCFHCGDVPCVSNMAYTASLQRCIDAIVRRKLFLNCCSFIKIDIYNSQGNHVTNQDESKIYERIFFLHCFIKLVILFTWVNPDNWFWTNSHNKKKKSGAYWSSVHSWRVPMSNPSPRMIQDMHTSLQLTTVYFLFKYHFGNINKKRCDPTRRVNKMLSLYFTF